jgi:hypothetical protein
LFDPRRVQPRALRSSCEPGLRAGSGAVDALLCGRGFCCRRRDDHLRIPADLGFDRLFGHHCGVKLDRGRVHLAHLQRLQEPQRHSSASVVPR